VIRELREDEWELLRRLRLRALHDSPESFSPLAEDAAREPDDFWQNGARRLASEHARLFVAERNDSPVGLVSATAAAGTGYIGAMWVDPAARGGGLGRALLDAACAWLRARGCARLALTVTETNSGAIALYESAGFRLTGESEPLREGSPLRNLKMIATAEARDPHLLDRRRPGAVLVVRDHDRAVGGERDRRIADVPVLAEVRRCRAALAHHELIARIPAAAVL
jgi:ribosomal protein S18 acetylase RimI-like enzyme